MGEERVRMKKLLTLGAVLPLFALALAIVAPTPEATAATQKQRTETTITVQKNQEKSKVKVKKKTTKTTFYSFTAQEGNSYSQMARKAVQAYAAKNKVKISEAGIVFAETNLTQAAGSPELSVGQKVEIKKADVKQWAKKATKLSEAEQAAWQAYVPYVNFNTDGVG